MQFLENILRFRFLVSIRIQIPYMILTTNPILNKCYLVMLDFVLCFVSKEKHKISTVLVGIRTLIFAKVFLSVVPCFTTDSRNGRGMICRTTAFDMRWWYLQRSLNTSLSIITKTDT